MCIDKLDDLVNKYNNTYHRTLKMKPADVKNHTLIDSGKKSNYKYPIFKVGDHVRKSKYKNRYTPNWSEVSVITKVKNTGHLLLMILIVKKLFESFMKKNCKKLTKNSLE